MRKFTYLASVAVLLSAMPGTKGMASPTDTPSAAGCDRACMTRLGDRLIATMVAHRPQDVPLTEYYRATENGVPAAIAMMSLWRTLSGAGARQYYIDTVGRQMLVLATVEEGPSRSLFWARLKVDGDRFSELEIYLTRSRGDAGFIFNADRLAALPSVWTRPVATARLPSRARLTELGRAMFSPDMPLPAAGPECALMENADIVREEPEWLAYMQTDAAMSKAALDREGQSLSMAGTGCPLFPGRPADRAARVAVVDAEQGVVVTIANLEGMVYNYPVVDPAWSAFVPAGLQAMHEDVLRRALATGKYRNPKVTTMPASIMVGQIWRIFDGKVQGFHMLQKLGPVGAGTPWTVPPQP